MNRIILPKLLTLMALFLIGRSNAQSPTPYSATYFAVLGPDTVAIETFNAVGNHIVGKAIHMFPEIHVKEYTIELHEDGSIREVAISYLNPKNTSLLAASKTGAFPLRFVTNCQTDTCTFQFVEKPFGADRISSRSASKVALLGDWIPLFALIDGACRRLASSGKKELSGYNLVNPAIGVHPFLLKFIAKDTILFGSNVCEYLKAKIDDNGDVTSIDGIGSAWNFTITKTHAVDIEQFAGRFAEKPEMGNPSPETSLQKSIQGATLQIRYGQPSKRGRKIFGAVVPYDSVWRTGAGRATILKTDKDLAFGKVTIPKGSYNLFTIPTPGAWQLIFNTEENVWGSVYRSQFDFVRFPIKAVRRSTIAEKFMIEIKETPSGGILKLIWDDTEAYTEFTLK